MSIEDDEFAEACSTYIRPKVADGLEDFARNLSYDIQERISVPVSYTSGPRGGTVIIRSQPGEPPRRENWDLWKSIEVDPPRDVSPTEVEVVVQTYYMVAVYLNDGTINVEKRPFWPTQTEMDGRADEVLSSIASKF